MMFDAHCIIVYPRSSWNLELKNPSFDEHNPEFEIKQSGTYEGIGTGKSFVDFKTQKAYPIIDVPCNLCGGTGEDKEYLQYPYHHCFNIIDCHRCNGTGKTEKVDFADVGGGDGGHE